MVRVRTECAAYRNNNNETERESARIDQTEKCSIRAHDAFGSTLARNEYVVQNATHKWQSAAVCVNFNSIIIILFKQ